ncbi:MAG TPA: iron-containing alcohol dehydrogenase family protein [Pseudothermotoga sp.]|nr:iron-containing alcohol dehydrogenase family protein [Pseudothermotoga sp.]HOK83081.1 iron-containing alcohol dehydrogenase family protein [Pseudothermotoga sp.]HPP69748.1 iron-containing alcohol dehydrogenase family protein [Pseudothermotoga sp.]
MWQYLMPTKIFFSQRVVEKNKEIFKNFGAKALVVTGRTSSRINGSLSDIENALKSMGIEFYVYDRIEENPTFEQIRQAVEECKTQSFDFVIGVGGGSPLDSAKAIAVLLRNRSLRVEDLYDSNKYSSALPIVAIPTTSGTGSEVTQYSVLTDDTGFKRGFGHDSIFPVIALIDPVYTVSMTVSLTRSTGLDALCHAVEGFLSKKATPISDLYAVESMKLIKENLPKALENPNDLEARTAMSFASCLAGMVISQTSTTLAHVLGYPLSTFKGIRHGDATAAFLDAVVHGAESEIPQKVQKVKEIFGDIKRFIESAGLKIELQLSDEELETWVKRALTAKHMQWTRGVFDELSIRKLYERMRID